MKFASAIAIALFVLLSAAALPFVLSQDAAAAAEPVTVSGRVVTGFDRTGLEGVHVSVDAKSDITDPDGYYSITLNKEVGVDKCVLHFELPGHRVTAFFYDGNILGWKDKFEIAVDSSNVQLLDVIMDEAFGTIEGKVTFNGKAVQGVVVDVHDRDSEEHMMKATTESGAYSFSLPVDGNYIISISSPYYYAEDVEIPLDDPKTVTHDFELELKSVATYLFNLDFTHSMMLIGGIIGLFLLIFAISYRIHISKHPESSKIHSDTKKKDQE